MTLIQPEQIEKLSRATTAALEGARTLDELLARVASEAVRILKLPAAGIWVCAGDALALGGRAGAPAAAIFTEASVRVGEGLVGGAAERGQSSLILGHSHDPAIAVPLSVGADLAGVLALSGRFPLSLPALQALRLLCNALALGIRGYSARAQSIQVQSAQVQSA